MRGRTTSLPRTSRRYRRTGCSRSVSTRTSDREHNQMKHITTEAARAGRTTLVRLGLGVLAFSLVACNTDKLVNVTNPDIVTGQVARDPANLNELRNGAQYEFARALTGPTSTNGTPGIVGISGLLTDELWYSS